MLHRFIALLFVVVMTGGLQAAEPAQDITYLKKDGAILAILNGKNTVVGNILYFAPQCEIKVLDVIKPLQKKRIGSQLFNMAINEMSRL